MRRLLPAAAAGRRWPCAACGSADEAATPAACLAPASAYLDALEAAPDAVRLDGSTPISDCFPAEQDAADLAQVGEAVIERRRGSTPPRAAIPAASRRSQLGYLGGARSPRGRPRRAASTPTSCGASTRRRSFAPGGEQLPASFQRAYDDGYAAGQQDG